MSYFFQRLIIFVTVSVVVYVFAPNLLKFNFHWTDWMYPLLSILIGCSAIYVIAFCIAELVGKLAIRLIPVESRVARDTMFTVWFMIGSGAFLFGPRPEGFSFGDNIGKIISDGDLTPYGWQVQMRAFAQCVLVSVLFWSICRIHFVNRHER